MFTRGERVLTPHGPGSVVSVRMDHLGDITKVAAVTVLLDKYCDDSLYRSRYCGTIYPASDVRSIEGEPNDGWEVQPTEDPSNG